MTKKLLPLVFVLLSSAATAAFAAPETAPAVATNAAAPVTVTAPAPVAASPVATPAAPSVSAAPVVTPPAKPGSVAANSIKVALNSADVATLDRDLLGIGATKARSIVEYREAHGPFAAVDELLEVRGIGESLLERNRERLTLD